MGLSSISRTKLYKFLFTKVKALQAFHLMRQGAIIVTSILFANSQLGMDLIGNYEQLVYVGYAISFFWVTGLIQGLLTSIPDLSERGQGVALWNTYLLFTGISVLLFAIFQFFDRSLLMIFTDKTELNYFHLFLIYLLINMPTYLVENFYLLKEKALAIYSFGVFSFFGHVMVLMFPIWLGWDFKYSIMGLVFLASLKHIWLLLMLKAYAIFELKIEWIVQWLSLSFPLILYALLGGLMQTFDSWLINYWYDGDPSKFAVFRYGARELPVVLALAAAFGTAMLPGLRSDLNLALKEIKSKSLKLLHLLFPLSILLLLTSKYWFVWVFSTAFEESVIIFNTYLLIISSRLIFSRTILVGLKDNKVVLWISLFEFLLNVVFSFILISYLGLFGVALATLLAFSAEKVLLCAYLYWKYKISIGAYAPLKWWAFYTLLLILAFGIGFY